MATIKVQWTVDLLDNVLTQFDVQRVYRSTTGVGGPYIEITTPSTYVTLVSGQTSYFFDDTSGSESYYYTVAYYNTSTLLLGSQSEPIPGNASTLPEILSLQDLYNVVGEGRVVQFFDDAVDGEVSDDNQQVNAILRAAEGELFTRMLRAYTSRESIIDLAGADPTIIYHLSMVAMEYASERRPEFTAADGKGEFWVAFERAITYFENLSKGKQRSRGEEVAGQGANTGGSLKPTLPSGSSRFVFAPDDDSPTGHGGFSWIPFFILLGEVLEIFGGF